jgi:hypothetical protein
MELLAEWAIQQPNLVTIFEPKPIFISNSSYSQNVPEHRLYIDPGDIGVFLFGNDARNNRLPFVKIAKDLNPSEFQTIKRILPKLKIARENECIFLFSDTSNKFRLTSIHFHSKRIPKSFNSLRLQLGLRKILHRFAKQGNSLHGFYVFFLLDHKVLIERAISFSSRKSLISRNKLDFRLR